MKHVERFKNRIFNRSSPSFRTEVVTSSDSSHGSSHATATSTTEPTEPLRRQRYGLFEFETNSFHSETSGSERFPVDIIAVHGLGGDAYKTWTHHETGKLWLRDFLPNFLPGCRVYTFGYPSKLTDVDMCAGVEEFARKLLGSLRDHIEDSVEGTRPIIFICHSLGGIVCKQALVYAHEDTQNYGAVLQSTLGVVFLATPHRGSDTANLASVFLTIANACQAFTTVGLRPTVARTDLVDYLNRNSKALQTLITSVRHRLKTLSIVTFYENKSTSPGSSLIVDRASAELGIANEEVLPLWEDHRSICRFDSDNAESYRDVSRAIRRIARLSPTLSPTVRRASTHSSNRSEQLKSPL